jgi:hypothetical protein
MIKILLCYLQAPEGFAMIESGFSSEIDPPGLLCKAQKERLEDCPLPSASVRMLVAPWSPGPHCEATTELPKPRPWPQCQFTNNESRVFEEKERFTVHQRAHLSKLHHPTSEGKCLLFKGRSGAQFEY